MQTYVALGSNFDRHNNIVQALSTLREHFGELQISNVYESTPFGKSDGNYFNLVVGFSTDDDVESIVRTLKSIERTLGRTAMNRKSKRVVIDLDLLSYAQCVTESEHFSLPHSDITAYDFVLKPLSEIAPNITHPVWGETYSALWVGFAGKSSILRDVSHLF